jgi:outer membrane protein assembly factor BamB
VDDDRLYTMYRVGNGRGRGGPWNAEEIVIAADSKTGRTVWEHKYPSRLEDFGQGAGPHSTPLIVGDRLFTIGTNKQLHAFDKRTGRVLWSHDLVTEYGAPRLLIRPVVKSGYGCSPIAYRDLVICFVGGPGQSVMAFRQRDGSVAWKNGHFLASESSPILITIGGQDQLLFFAGSAMVGLDPMTGAVLWAHAHDAGNDFNFSLPLWGADNVLFMSSGYRAGSRAIRLTRSGVQTITEELWFTSRVKFQFLNAVRLGDFVYGSSGEFTTAFLTAVSLETGETTWRHRTGQATVVSAGDKAIVLSEDGDLSIGRLTPEAFVLLGEAKIFDTTAWTVPTLVGTTLYARDREKIVALDLGVRPRG